MLYRIKGFAHREQKTVVCSLTCSVQVSVEIFHLELLLAHHNIEKTLTLRAREGSKLQGEQQRQGFNIPDYLYHIFRWIIYEYIIIYMLFFLLFQQI